MQFFQARTSLAATANDPAGKFGLHGQPYQQTLADMGSSDPVLNRALRAMYLKKMPGGISETLRAAIHFALGTTPPTNVTFLPGPRTYDWEITVLAGASDTAQDQRRHNRAGQESRYPDDAHPLKSWGIPGAQTPRSEGALPGPAGSPHGCVRAGRRRRRARPGAASPPARCWRRRRV